MSDYGLGVPPLQHSIKIAVELTELVAWIETCFCIVSLGAFTVIDWSEELYRKTARRTPSWLQVASRLKGVALLRVSLLVAIMGGQSRNSVILAAILNRIEGEYAKGN